MAATPAAADPIAAPVGKRPPRRRSHHKDEQSNSTLPHGHPTTHTSWPTSTAALHLDDSAHDPNGEIFPILRHARRVTMPPSSGQPRPRTEQCPLHVAIVAPRRKSGAARESQHRCQHVYTPSSPESELTRQQHYSQPWQPVCTLQSHSRRTRTDLQASLPHLLMRIKAQRPAKC